MTYDGLNRSNIIIAGKKQLLKVSLALIISFYSIKILQ